MPTNYVVAWSTIIAAVGAVIAVVLQIYFGLYPNSPPPFRMADNVIYDTETPLSEIISYATPEAGFVPLFTIRVVDASGLFKGKTIGFHGLRCIVHRIEPPGTLLRITPEPLIKWPLSADIACQIVSGWG